MPVARRTIRENNRVQQDSRAQERISGADPRIADVTVAIGDKNDPLLHSRADAAEMSIRAWQTDPCPFSLVSASIRTGSRPKSSVTGLGNIASP